MIPLPLEIFSPPEESGLKSDECLCGSRRADAEVVYHPASVPSITPFRVDWICLECGASTHLDRGQA